MCGDPAAAMPYRLFALSNFGSMLALISFPFLVEPKLTSRQQAFTLEQQLMSCSRRCARSRHGRAAQVSEDADAVGCDPRRSRPACAQLILWVALAACASTLLVSVTNHLSQNVAPIPLLWVLPLALYLLTFILAFESDRIYQRWMFLPLLVPALGGDGVHDLGGFGESAYQMADPGIRAGSVRVLHDVPWRAGAPQAGAAVI